MTQTTNAKNNCFFGFTTEKGEICFLNSKGETQKLTVKKAGKKFLAQPDAVFPLYNEEYFLGKDKRDIIEKYLNNEQEIICLEYIGYKSPAYFKEIKSKVPA